MKDNETRKRRKPINVKPNEITLVTQIRLIPNKVYDKQVTKEGQNLMTFAESKKRAIG